MPPSDFFEKLVADHPENLEYQIGQARCLRNLGPVLADAGHLDRAENLYRQGLKLLQTGNKNQNGQTTDVRSVQGDLLNNLGDLERRLDRPEAEKTLCAALGIFESLAAHESHASKDRHHLAVAQINLAQLLVELKCLPEATTLSAQSVINLEKLVDEVPKAIDFQSHLGVALAAHGKCLVESGKMADAKTAFQSAVSHQRQAVQLSRNRDQFRTLFGEHLLDLAQANISLNDYKAAAANALDVPNAVPISERGQGCLDAARILAPCHSR